MISQLYKINKCFFQKENLVDWEEYETNHCFQDAIHAYTTLLMIYIVHLAF